MVVALVVVAKIASATESKTRLAPVLSDRARRALAEAFFDDTLARARAVSGVETLVAFSPDHAAPWLEQRFGAALPWIAQGPGSLGDRLSRVSQQLFARGYAGVIFIGTDTPTLPPSRIALARDVLFDDRAQCELVLGPAEDGGYYLLAARRHIPALFEGIAWGTDTVLAQTEAAARVAGVRVRRLDPWWDVDTPEDLARLARACASDPEARARAPRTAAVLDELAVDASGCSPWRRGG
jgi:rSAM/selenodomain-associated transferase 1